VNDSEPARVGDFRLGDWLVEPRLNRISRGDSTITLELKVMQVLVCLAENAGDLVSRQQLTDTVWATEFISDNTVTHAITELRNALGDDAKSPTFVETIHRRGYRLVAPVEWVSGDDCEGGGQVPNGRPRWPHILAIAIAAVIGLLVILPPEALFERRGEGTTDEPLPRIVVLPFENLGPPEDEYFADGVTEEIISRLAAVSGLQVISRTSAMYYKGRHLPIRQIGEELEVGYVLEGTIRWDRSEEGHGRVRINPQLIKVADDSHLWSDRYYRVMEDFFSVQTDIAENVIAQLQATILEPEQHTIVALPTNNIEAYQAYLSGMKTGITEREEELELAARMFERAIELDPEFALAYARLSEVSSQMVHYRIDLSPERLEIAANAAARAVELEPDLSETHRARASYYYHALRDYDGALKELDLAALKSPGDGSTLAAIGWVERRQNKWHDSLFHVEKAIQLDPRNDVLLWNQGITRLFVRDYEGAVNQLQRAISIAPDRIETYHWLAEAYRLWDGSPERARAVIELMPRESHQLGVYAWLVQNRYEGDFKRALDRVRGTTETIIKVRDKVLPTALVECECLFALGRFESGRDSCEKALVILQIAAEESPRDPRMQSALGKVHALLGNNDESIRHGQRAVAFWPVSKDAVDGCSFELYLAEIYALTGELELATAKLEYLLSIPSPLSAASLQFDPKWDPLRDHPRFKALLEKYDTEK